MGKREWPFQPEPELGGICILIKMISAKHSSNVNQARAIVLSHILLFMKICGFATVSRKQSELKF